MDLAGIIGKLEHVLDTYDELLKTEVQRVAPNAKEAEVNTLSNQLEVAIGLDTMFRVVRHYYLLAKKQGGILALAQLQMALPTIMEEAEAYSAAIDAFATGKPIGDGAGPLIASRLAMGVDGNETVKDTMVYDVPFEGRNMMVVRAKGPGGNVGKPGSLVEKLIQEKGPVSLVMTVDAALKLEGEPSGEIAEGVGAAIGGPGTEKLHIEVSAVKQGIPFNEALYGPRLYDAFRQVKRAFDPKGLLTPGNIVDAPPVTEPLRFGPSYRTWEPETLLDFSPQGGFAAAVEMCNGIGVCRKKLEGTMCPSYMATLDEEHSTRGRANALRAVLSGRAHRADFTRPRPYQWADL